MEPERASITLGNTLVSVSRETSSRTLFGIGVDASIPLSPFFDLGLELFWMQKGTKAETRVHAEGTVVTISIEENLSYLSFPLNLKIGPNISGRQFDTKVYLWAYKYFQ